MDDKDEIRILKISNCAQWRYKYRKYQNLTPVSAIKFVRLLIEHYPVYILKTRNVKEVRDKNRYPYSEANVSFQKKRAANVL